MHSLPRIILVAICLSPMACGNKGDLYLESSEVLQRELDVLDEALDTPDDNTGERPEEEGEPRKRRPNANDNNN